jgi:hypothetical protein
MVCFHWFLSSVMGVRFIAERTVDYRIVLNRNGATASDGFVAISRFLTGPGRLLESVAVAASREELSIAFVAAGWAKGEHFLDERRPKTGQVDSNARHSPCFASDPHAGRVVAFYHGHL